MGRLFRFCLLIIALFIAASAIGYFISPVKSVERSIQINAPRETVFPYLSDMQDFEVWSPWRSDDLGYEYIVGGAEAGVGQRAAWTCPAWHCPSGMQEIVIVQPLEFVQTLLILDRDRADATYAIMKDENFDDLVSVVVKVDLDVGGFPYIQRLLRSRRDKQLETRLNEALLRLKSFAQADAQ